MSQSNIDYTTFLTMQKSTLAPLARFGEAGVKTLERVLQHQYTVAGDILEYGIAQLNAMSTAVKDPASVLSQQMTLASDFVAKQTTRSNDLVKIAGETQAEFGRLIEAVGDEARTTRKVA